MNTLDILYEEAGRTGATILAKGIESGRISTLPEPLERRWIRAITLARRHR